MHILHPPKLRQLLLLRGAAEHGERSAGTQRCVISAGVFHTCIFIIIVVLQSSSTADTEFKHIASTELHANADTNAHQPSRMRPKPVVLRKLPELLPRWACRDARRMYPEVCYRHTVYARHLQRRKLSDVSHPARFTRGRVRSVFCGVRTGVPCIVVVVVHSSSAADTELKHAVVSIRLHTSGSHI